MSQSKKQLVHHASSSLWNYTLSPGWTQKEVEILNLALMKFGIGRWHKIMNSDCLPGKSIGQIYMQTQRLLGQQSLGEFMNLQVDLKKVYLNNMAKKNVFRKNNSIINTGDNMTQEEKQKKIQENAKLYGIGKDVISSIKLPRYYVSEVGFLSHEEVLNGGKFTTLEKVEKLTALRRDVLRKIKKIENGELEEQEDDEDEYYERKRYKKVKATQSESSEQV